MDVVTANRADWQRDPYRLIEENGYFFGRGTSDVKQEVALLTTTFLDLKAQGFVPTRDLIIAFSGDEETEQATASDLVTKHRDLVDAEYRPEWRRRRRRAQRGDRQAAAVLRAGRREELGRISADDAQSGGHSSMPRADNAIYELADALKAVQHTRISGALE